MTWGEVIQNAGKQATWNVAWRRGQRIRNKVELLSEHFFTELTTVGVGFPAPPDLGQYTPTWAPLSDNWIERKGHEDFFFDTGKLLSSLLRKTTVNVFGRPQVFLQFDGNNVRVHAGEAAGKYKGSRLQGMKIVVIPFPKITAPGEAEELVAGTSEDLYFKIGTEHGNTPARPLITPFAKWYVHVKLRKALKEL